MIDKNISPPRYIRIHVFKMTQQQLAAVLRVTQGRIAQIEKRGFFEPEHRQKILALAIKKGVEFKAAWFDGIPKQGA